MGLFSIAAVAVLVLLVIGLGWKTVASGTINGFNIVVDKGGPALKELTNSAKDHISNTSDDVIQNTIDEVLNK
jgi:hypothetical protein